jgi:hypothetical protein
LFPTHDTDALVTAIRRVVEAECERVHRRDQWTWADSTRQLVSVIAQLVGRRVDGYALSGVRGSTLEQGE